MFLGPRGGKQIKAYTSLGAVGIKLGLSTVFGLLVGQWADKKLGTEPWLLIFGLLLGVTSGFRSLYREALKANARSSAEPTDPPEKPDDDTESAGILLLGDMRQLLNNQNTDRISSKALADHLAEMEERPWPEWKNSKPITVRQIARLLARYAIKPKTIKGINLGKDAKGYEKSDCQEAFDSYLSPPDPDLDPSPPSPTSNDADLREKTIRHQSNPVTDRKTGNPTPLLRGDGVTDQNGVTEQEESVEELF